MWSSIPKEILKNIQNEDYGIKILEKGQFLRPFSGIAPKKMKILSKKCKGIKCLVMYIYIFVYVLCIYIYRRADGLYT